MSFEIIYLILEFESLSFFGKIYFVFLGRGIIIVFFIVELYNIL